MKIKGIFSKTYFLSTLMSFFLLIGYMMRIFGNKMITTKNRVGPVIIQPYHSQSNMYRNSKPSKFKQAFSKLFLRRERQLLSENSSSPSPIELGTRVVTDIDDTVKSSGGKKFFGIALGGIDIQYERGKFYPGVFQFAFELSHAAFEKMTNRDVSIQNQIQFTPPKVAVLTARAKELKFALKIRDNDKISLGYKSIGKENGHKEWGIGQVYYGSIREWIFSHKKGIRKFQNFEIMMQHDQKKNNISDYILIGDTGEKDEDAGERIANKYGRSTMKAIFLHKVTDDHSLATSSVNGKFSLPVDRVCNNVPIFYFRTYVGAAIKAMNADLISSEAVNRIIVDAENNLKQYDNSKKLSSKQSRLIVSSRWKDLQDDIAEAKLSLQKSAKRK